MSFAERPYWEWDNFKVSLEGTENFNLTFTQNPERYSSKLQFRVSLGTLYEIED